MPKNNNSQTTEQLLSLQEDIKSRQKTKKKAVKLTLPLAEKQAEKKKASVLQPKQPTKQAQNSQRKKQPKPVQPQKQAPNAEVKPKQPQQRIKKKATAAVAAEKTLVIENPQQKRQLTSDFRSAPVRIIALGGLNEIGKNLYVYECANDMFIIDCGLAFPDEDMLGVDIVIPDFSYLEKNKDKIRGIALTHGHEDHIGSLAYLLKKINVPVYGTRLTLGLVEGKLKEHGILSQCSLNVVVPRQTVKMGCMSAEFIQVNHSIPDAYAIAVHTPAGVIIHTGDFKVDYTPIEGDNRPCPLRRTRKQGRTRAPFRKYERGTPRLYRFRAESRRQFQAPF